MVLAIWGCCTNYTVGGSLTVFLSKQNLGRYQRDFENAKAEASLKVSHEARSRALEEAHEADRRREAVEKRAWEIQAWSASLE